MVWQNQLFLRSLFPNWLVAEVCRVLQEYERRSGRPSGLITQLHSPRLCRLCCRFYQFKNQIQLADESR